LLTHLDDEHRALVHDIVASAATPQERLDLTLLTLPYASAEVFLPLVRVGLSALDEIPQELHAHARRMLSAYVGAPQVAELLSKLEAKLAESEAVDLLCELSPFLNGEALHFALERIRVMGAAARARVLSRLSPQLSASQIKQALSDSKIIADGTECDRVRLELAVYLSEPLRSATLREGLSRLEEVFDESSRAKLLTVMAPKLNHAEFDRILPLVYRLGEGLRAHVLSTLAPYLTQSQLASASEVAAAIKTSYFRVRALSGMLSSAAGSLRDKIFKLLSARAARFGKMSAIDSELWTAVSHVEASERELAARNATLEVERRELLSIPEVMGRSLGATRALGAVVKAMSFTEKWSGEAIFAGLTGALARASRPNIDASFEKILGFDSDESRSWAMRAFVPYVNDAQRQRILHEASRFDDPRWLVVATSRMATVLSRSQRDSLIVGCERLEDTKQVCIEILKDLVDCLDAQWCPPAGLRGANTEIGRSRDCRLCGSYVGCGD